MGMVLAPHPQHKDRSDSRRREKRRRMANARGYMHKCEDCEQRFVNAGNLGIHRRTHDRKRKAYICAYYRRSFLYRARHWRHEKPLCKLRRVKDVHVGDRRVRCSRCSVPMADV